MARAGFGYTLMPHPRPLENIHSNKVLSVPITQALFVQLARAGLGLRDKFGHALDGVNLAKHGLSLGVAKRGMRQFR